MLKGCWNVFTNIDIGGTWHRRNGNQVYQKALLKRLASSFNLFSSIRCYLSLRGASALLGQHIRKKKFTSVASSYYFFFSSMLIILQESLFFTARPVNTQSCEDSLWGWAAHSPPRPLWERGIRVDTSLLRYREIACTLPLGGRAVTWNRTHRQSCWKTYRHRHLCLHTKEMRQNGGSDLSISNLKCVSKNYILYS